MRNKFIATALAFSPLAVFADDADVTTIETLTTQIQTKLSALVPAIAVAIGGVVVSCLVFWGIRALVRFARQYFGK